MIMRLNIHRFIFLFQRTMCRFYGFARPASSGEADGGVVNDSEVCNHIVGGPAPPEMSVASVLALRPNDKPEDAYEVFQDEVRYSQFTQHATFCWTFPLRFSHQYRVAQLNMEHGLTHDTDVLVFTPIAMNSNNTQSDSYK